MTLNERMKQYIFDNDLKQSTIAKKMGILESKFSMMLNGKRKILADDLRSFCKAVKESPELFIPFNDDEDGKEK